MPTSDLRSTVESFRATHGHVGQKLGLTGRRNLADDRQASGIVCIIESALVGAGRSSTLATPRGFMRLRTWHTIRSFNGILGITALPDPRCRMRLQVERLRTFSSTVVSDALDRCGVGGVLTGIHRMSGDGAVAGPAFTVRYVDQSAGEPGDVGDFLDEVAPGDIVVIDEGGRVDCSIWGSLTTLAARQRGIAGTVIDGACRDIESLRRSGYPVHARGHTPRTGKDRVRMASEGEPVQLAGVRIVPHDLVLADEDGIVVVPRPHVDEVLSAAEHIREHEDRIAAAVTDGAALAD